MVKRRFFFQIFKIPSLFLYVINELVVLLIDQIHKSYKVLMAQLHVVCKLCCCNVNGIELNLSAYYVTLKFIFRGSYVTEAPGSKLDQTSVRQQKMGKLHGKIRN